MKNTIIIKRKKLTRQGANRIIYILTYLLCLLFTSHLGAAFDAWQSVPCPAPGTANLELSHDPGGSTALVRCLETADKYQFRWLFISNGFTIGQEKDWVKGPVTKQNHTKIRIALASYDVQCRKHCNGSWSKWSSSIRIKNCIVPASFLSVRDVSYTSAHIECLDCYNAQIRYKPKTSNEWIEGDQEPFEIEQLIPGTEYEYQAMMDCGRFDSSPWSSSQTFRTADCPAPSRIVYATTTSKITLDCEHPNSEGFRWFWRRAGQSSWHFRNQTNSTLTLEYPKVVPGTRYEVMVKAECPEDVGDGFLSEGSEIFSIQTECDVIRGERY